jgi:membrane fusion protein, heavy metal efflux system
MTRIAQPGSRTKHRAVPARGRVVLVLALIAALALPAGSVHGHEGHAPLPSKGVEINVEAGTVLLTRSAADALAVQSIEVMLAPDVEEVLAYARLVTPWHQQALVSSRLAGRVTEVYVRPGDPVTEGQVLAELECPALESMQLDLLAAVNAARLSGKLASHYRALGGEVLPLRQADEALSAEARDQSALLLARQRLTSLGLSPQFVQDLETGGDSLVRRTLPVTSPIAGRVQLANANVGKVIEPVEHLFEIRDSSSLWCRVDLLESELHRVAPGQPVSISLTALPGTMLRGVVAWIEPRLDPETRLVSAWVDLEPRMETAPDLLPGMFGEARIAVAHEGDLMTVPAIAVARDGAERFVLVQLEATAKTVQFAKRNVVVVREAGGRVQFRSNAVFPGDLVATVGAHELFNCFVQSVLQLSPEARENIKLRVAAAGPAVIDEVIQANGVVELPASGRDDVSARMAGQLVAIHVERGATVRAGQVLGEITSLELQAMQLDLIAAQLEYDRIEQLHRQRREATASRSLPQREQWEIESALQNARQQRDSLQRTLAGYGLDQESIDRIRKDKTVLQSIPLRATLGGNLVGFYGRLGQAVEPGTRLFEIHNPDETLVRAWISEPASAAVREGSPALVRLIALPGSAVPARVHRLSQELDPVSRTLPVWLKLDVLPEVPLAHDLLADVKLVTSQSSVPVAVSMDAIVRDGTLVWVFVQRADGRFERRALRTGKSDGRQIEVLSGLQAGEQVAVWGAGDLQSAYASLR